MLARGGAASLDFAGFSDRKKSGHVQMQFMPALEQPDGSVTRAFVVCTIPKNGSTRWKQLMLKVLGYDVYIMGKVHDPARFLGFKSAQGVLEVWARAWGCGSGWRSGGATEVSRDVEEMHPQ